MTAVILFFDTTNLIVKFPPIRFEENPRFFGCAHFLIHNIFLTTDLESNINTVCSVKELK